MQFKRNEPGVIVSAAVHAAVLAASLVAFSTPHKFEDAQEAIPVEMITESELNQITRGEKTAKPEQAKPRVDTKAEQEEQRPTPPIAEAKRDVPTPPPSLKRIPDPSEEDAPEPPKVAALPPQRPVPETKPEPPEPTPPAPPARPPAPKPEAKPEPKPEPPKPVVKEATEPPPPPPRPKPAERQAEAKPEPEERPAPTPPRRPNIPRKVEEKPKPDQIAKLEETTRDVKPAPRPRSGEESPEQRRYDPSAISKILATREAAQQRGSTGQTPQRQAALGSPTANAPRMSPSLSAQLNGLLIDQYKKCWSYIGTAQASGYQPQISVSLSQEGALVGRPQLRNPPSDPNMRSLADSALRAVQNPRCNPLQIPAQYMPYYHEWKDLLLRFDPAEMMG